MYDHRYWKTRDPVRSPIDKPVIVRLVLGWVTTGESLMLYIFCSALPTFSILCFVGKSFEHGSITVLSSVLALPSSQAVGRSTVALPPRETSRGRHLEPCDISQIFRHKQYHRKMSPGGGDSSVLRPQHLSETDGSLLRRVGGNPRYGKHENAALSSWNPLHGTLFRADAF
ncbi:hypothetical protein BR93DRAFT_141390 [Coniochaeta sp. PMI_546]|nr:hypothetical protein BR93DRAFT_141390 [Coniochaeta sp. PMI_546]